MNIRFRNFWKPNWRLEIYGVKLVLYFIAWWYIEKEIFYPTLCWNICLICFNTFVTDAIPTTRAMYLQIYVAMKAMPWYTALPTLSEYMVENGWTRCYSSISDVGWPAYFVNLAVYLVFVEFGIYWMHRELHDIKPLYKYLHATHHIYNKQNTLSPFAGKLCNLFPLPCLCCGAIQHFRSQFSSLQLQEMQEDSHFPSFIFTISHEN